MKKKTIYIPIETKAREFVSQVLLAGKIADFGGRVYLGSKAGVFRALIMKSEFGGTFLYKGGMGVENGFRELKKLVARVAVLDQEISPAHTDSNPADRFLENELGFVDRLYYVGEVRVDQMLAARPDLPRAKVVALGWPRVDLWGNRYSRFWEPQAAKLVERFGRFVLFSSDFGVLHPNDFDFVIKQNQFYRGTSRSGAETLNLLRESESVVREFNQIVAIIRNLDEEPNFPPVVIRPHPAENAPIWYEAIKAMKKSFVVFEGDITPWLHASVALLHRGCTTALQAEVLGKPAGFLQSAESRSQNRLSRASAFSKPIANVEDALDLVDPGYKIPVSQIDPARIASLDGTASEKIAKDLIALTAQKEDALPRPWRALLRRQVIARLTQEMLRWCLNRLRSRVFSVPKNFASNKMSGGVDASEVKVVLEGLGMKHLHVSDVAENLVCIEKG